MRLKAAAAVVVAASLWCAGPAGAADKPAARSMPKQPPRPAASVPPPAASAPAAAASAPVLSDT